MSDPVKKTKTKKEKIGPLKKAIQTVKQYIPGKGRLLKKILFDVEGEHGTDNRRKIKL